MTTHSSVPAGQRAQFARLVAQAWSDPALAQRYEDDPFTVLAEYGITVTDRVAPSLPDAPVEVELEDLGTAAGAAMATIGTVSCPTACLGIVE